MSEQVWTVKAALDWTRGYLAEKGDENPRLSAEWLLSAATGLSRIELYVHHDRPLSPVERATLRDGVKRRATGEPLQYVTGEVAFRHIVVNVRPGVLIPRPETEILVGEAFSAISAMDEPTVLDLGTGSGCIALSLAQEHIGSRVFATDVSPLAVEVASDNAERLGLADAVTVLGGDLFGPLPNHLRGCIDAVVSNPPYIPSADVPQLPAEVAGFEPHLALDGGSDGLDFWRRIAEESREWLRPGGHLLVELDERCVDSASEGARIWYEDVSVIRDLAGRPRIVRARLPETA